LPVISAVREKAVRSYRQGYVKTAVLKRRIFTKLTFQTGFLAEIPKVPGMLFYRLKRIVKKH
jgi:hypothetical protein